LLWETENEELLEPCELMLFKLHLSTLKEIIKDLEDEIQNRTKSTD